MHTVRSGDTLYSISMEHQVPLALLLRANPYVDVYNLQVGETICVPVRANDRPVMPPYGGTCSKWEVRDAVPMTETESKVAEEMTQENAQTNASGGQQGDSQREDNVMEDSRMGANRTEEGITGDSRVGASRMEDNVTRDSRVSEIRREEGIVGDGRMNETGMDVTTPIPGAAVEMPVHGMEHTESEKDESVYIVRDGDTLESILGVGRIVLQPGTALYRQK